MRLRETGSSPVPSGSVGFGAPAASCAFFVLGPYDVRRLLRERSVAASSLPEPPVTPLPEAKRAADSNCDSAGFEESLSDVLCDFP